MATPSFIYAFDNLGPDHFAELCGLLFTSKYKGFRLGGIGPDGGVDGEMLGELHTETQVPLLTGIIQPGQLIVFQFKHQTDIRVGQGKARSQILKLYTSCTEKKPCE